MVPRSSSIPLLGLCANMPPSPSSLKTPLESGRQLEDLRRDVALLEKQLFEMRSSIDQTTAASEALRARAVELREAMSVHQKRRQDAMDSVRGLSKLELAEIRQLSKCPPPVIKRLLSATWIVLNAERFEGKSSVCVNTQQNWARCQRMLADDGFIDRILFFDTACFEKIPHVAVHLMKNYIGFPSAMTQTNGAPEGETPHMPPVKSSPQLRSSASSPAFGGAGRSNSLSAPPTARLPATPPRRRRSSSRASMRSASKGSHESAESGAEQLALLDEHAVEFAHAPCGALLRWMQEVVLRKAEGEQMQVALEQVECSITSTEERLQNARKRAEQLQDLVSHRRKRLASKILSDRFGSPESTLLPDIPLSPPTKFEPARLSQVGWNKDGKPDKKGSKYLSPLEEALMLCSKQCPGRLEISPRSRALHARVEQSIEKASVWHFGRQTALVA